MIFGEDDDAKIDELQKWFRENPKLPAEIERLLLKRFYQSMYADLGETKKVIELNYALRNKHERIFLQRDPCDEDSRLTFEFADMVPLPGLTPEKYKVSCYRLRDQNPHKMRHAEDTKAFFMFTDCRFARPDLDGLDTTLADGEVQIFDLAGFTMKHVTKLSISVLRVYIKFLQEAFPVRLRAIHMINCPPYLDRIVAVVKPFIGSEVFKLIHFHTSGLESLYDYVPRAMLPEEYGGEAGKMADLKSEIMNILEKKRDYLMDPRHWKIEAASASSAKGGGGSRWAFF